MKLLLIAAFSFLLIVHAPAQSTNSTMVDTAKKEFTSIQVQAKFPGGAEGWVAYLQKNLKAELGAQYIKLKRSEQEVRQTIIVSFLVNKEGKISEVTVANPTEVHPKLAEEAVRVIKQGPDWIPATINGEPVIYRQKQSITFAVSRG